MFDDIFKIVTALIGICIGTEADGGTNEEKQKKAILQIMAAIKGEGGIHVTNKWVLQGLDFLLPLIIKYIVVRLNASGFFAK
jgi:hypothetical protein